MSRTRFTGPVTGAYDTLPFFLPTNAGKAVYIAPTSCILMEVELYAQTSTAGTLTVANTTQSVTWVNAASVAADTPITVAAAALNTAGVRTIVKGDTITISGGGTLTNATVVLSIYNKDHVVSLGELPDPLDLGSPSS